MIKLTTRIEEEAGVAVVGALIKGMSGVEKSEMLSSGRLVAKGVSINAPNIGYGETEICGQEKQSIPEGPHEG